MKLYKFDIMLCLAYQGSDGPFDVRIHRNNGDVWLCLTKDEIDCFSDMDDVLVIYIQEPRSDRRWIMRNDKDRRS